MQASLHDQTKNLQHRRLQSRICLVSHNIRGCQEMEGNSTSSLEKLLLTKTTHIHLRLMNTLLISKTSSESRLVILIKRRMLSNSYKRFSKERTWLINTTLCKLPQPPHQRKDSHI